MGDLLVGLFPEAMPGLPEYLEQRGNKAKTCEISDMVLLALSLTRAEIGDYWDDADRWVRDMYSEAQMRAPPS